MTPLKQTAAHVDRIHNLLVSNRRHPRKFVPFFLPRQRKMLHLVACGIPFFPVNSSQNVMLVGNSATVLQSCVGHKIDAADFVVRFNLAPLHPFECTGQKNNARIVNARVFLRHYSNIPKSTTIIVTEPSGTPNHRVLQKMQASPHIYLIDDRYVSKELKKFPTSGIMGITWFLQNATVAICGFNFSSNHYFNNRGPRPGNRWHDYRTEKSIVSFLIRKQIVTKRC